MNVIKTDFVKGAQKAKGIAVIIDVFRAFSVACYCVDRGAEKMMPVASIEEALAFQERDNSLLCIGEREGKKLPGFDFGNSPTEIISANLQGRAIVQTTHAGTLGLLNAVHADEVLTGAFVNAKATVEYIKSRQPKQVTLVRMGWQAETRSDEDDLCADYMEHLLLDKPFDTKSIYTQLKNSPCASRFFDPAIPWNPISDFKLCLDIDRFQFALKLERDEQGVYFLESPLN